VLTVKAERRYLPPGDDVQMQVAERPQSVFSRQLFLGDTLDTDRIAADYDTGVLTLRIPVAERAKPRRIEGSLRAVWGLPRWRERLANVCGQDGGHVVWCVSVWVLPLVLVQVALGEVLDAVAA
jgi:hypothetical protein